ncbi:MAG: helix-turn-helix domain-containing protein [Polyangiales bacterium]
MHTIYFALLPDVVLLDVAESAEAFRLANQLVPGSYELQFVAPVPRLCSGVGLWLDRLSPLPAAVPDQALLVLTGVVGRRLDLRAPATRRTAAWVARAMHNETATLMCVCAGALIAAQAGLLHGVECTTHHAHLEELAQLEPAAVVHANRIFVEHGRICTSAGVTAGLDLTLHLIGQQLGHRVAASVARELVVYTRRAGNDPALSPWIQHRNHLHAAVHRVQDAVSAHPGADWSSEQLAKVAHTSERHLARLFAEHAQCSPLDYVQRIRIALARELISHSDLDLEHIAERAGFSSAHQLRRVWRRWETSPPSSLRSV